MSTSIYAPALRERGFTPTTAEEQAYLERRLELRFEQLNIPKDLAKLPRSKRRKIEKLINERSFVSFREGTAARDEKGGWWVSPAVVNLSGLGFKDLTPFKGIAAALPPLDTKKSTH